MRTLRPMRCFVGPRGFLYVLCHASRLSKRPCFGGYGGYAARQGAVSPKFELGRNFRTMHLPPKFHHLMFSRSEVMMLTNTRTNPHTNKQTPLKTSNGLRWAGLLCWEGLMIVGLCTWRGLISLVLQ